MKLESVGEVIAKRKLVLLRHEGKSEVVILLGKPRCFPDADFPKPASYFCPFQIKGLGDEAVISVGGVDGVQAIELAMKIIASCLSVSLGDRPGARLVWGTEEPDDAQFPWPYLESA